MKNINIRTGLVVGIALLGIAFKAGAWGGPYQQALTEPCDKIVSDCQYDDQGNCVGGTITDTPGSEVICAAASSGHCTAQACVYGSPTTTPCCSN